MGRRRVGILIGSLESATKCFIAMSNQRGPCWLTVVDERLDSEEAVARLAESFRQLCGIRARFPKGDTVYRVPQ